MQEIQKAKFEFTSAQIFAVGFLAFVALTATLIGSFPLQASIVTIFLFAGVHNFFEFRYFLARMPVRWGKSRTFYSFGIGGVLVLTAAYPAIYLAGDDWFWSLTDWQTTISFWNTLFVLWIGLLIFLRGRQKPRTDWSWAFAPACLVCAFVWFAPQFFSLALVYLHPFIAMWFLERQIRRTKKEWLDAYHLCLLTVPFFVLILYFAFAGAPNLPNETNLFWRITQHAGSQILPNISTHFLVATHVFLETIHYTVWILLIPLIDKRAVPWKIKEIPLAAKSKGFPKLVFGVLTISLIIVCALWFGFTVDYTTTRDVYFAFAMAHVLAEFPFLIKML